MVNTTEIEFLDALILYLKAIIINSCKNKPLHKTLRTDFSSVLIDSPVQMESIWANCFQSNSKQFQGEFPHISWLVTETLMGFNGIAKSQVVLPSAPFPLHFTLWIFVQNSWLFGQLSKNQLDGTSHLSNTCNFNTFS